MLDPLPQDAKAGGLAAFQPLNAAEQKVLDELLLGDFCTLGDGSRPEPEDLSRTVRAEFLRFLILGGAEGHRPHEKGVRLRGALVSGVLDLEGCRIARDIGLRSCRFEAAPVLRSAIIDNLFLDESSFPGLQADRLEARGGLYIRQASISRELRLVGAKFGGSLECSGVTVDWLDGFAIDASGLHVQGAVRLRGAEVRGGINLSVARLGSDFDGAGILIERPKGIAFDGDGMKARGDLSLPNATISGEISVQGASFGGDVDCTGTKLMQPGGDALKLNRSNIDGAFFLRHGAKVHGILNLTAATIGAIDDELESWPEAGNLLLNRCQYGAFIGGPADARSRLDWLSRQLPSRWGEDFWPQPYEHLATVFSQMGHDEEARSVLIEKERLQRRARRARAPNTLWRGLLWAKDGMLGITLLYGRQPLIAFLWLALFWALGVAVFSLAEYRGALKPNSSLVLRSLDWTLCSIDQAESQLIPSLERSMNGRASEGQTQFACFLEQPEMLSYPQFNAWIFSLDVLLPVLDIGQKANWRPDPSKPSGAFVLNYYYFQSIVGWALSLLAVAGFSGLVKSK